LFALAGSENSGADSKGSDRRERRLLVLPTFQFFLQSDFLPLENTVFKFFSAETITHSLKVESYD
jgi:hypothetical protein